MKLHSIVCTFLVIVQSTYAVHKKKPHKILSRQQYLEWYAQQQEKIRMRQEKKQKEARNAWRCPCQEFFHEYLKRSQAAEASLPLRKVDESATEKKEHNRCHFYPEIPCAVIIGCLLKLGCHVTDSRSVLQILNLTTSTK